MVNAKTLMTTGVITVKKDSPVKDVVKLMADNNLEALPVLDSKDHLVGIITDGDLMIRASKFYKPLFNQMLDGLVYLENPKVMEMELKKIMGTNAGEIMTRRVVSVNEETSLEELATIMVGRKVKRLPVVKDKKLVGIISRRDIIKVLANNNLETD